MRYRFPELEYFNIMTHFWPHLFAAFGLVFWSSSCILKLIVLVLLLKCSHNVLWKSLEYIDKYLNINSYSNWFHFTLAKLCLFLKIHETCLLYCLCYCLCCYRQENFCTNSGISCCVFNHTSILPLLFQLCCYNFMV